MRKKSRERSTITVIVYTRDSGGSHKVYDGVFLLDYGRNSNWVYIFTEKETVGYSAANVVRIVERR